MMLAEDGWRFLLVDGGCTAWVLASSGNPVARRTLSADDEAQLAAALRLSTWDRITPPAGGCPDAPSISYRFGGQRLSGTACGVDPSSAWGELRAATDEQIDRLAASGEPWGGDLRYLVLQESNQTDSRPPVAWPLSSALGTIALDAGHAFSYQAGGSLRATGDAAAKLRAIRTTDAGSMAAYGVSYHFTRVTDSDGGAYQLYIRDAVPFEQDNGLVPGGVF